MAYENIRLNKPNIAIVGSYFYSIDEVSNSLWVKLADGSLATQFPTDTLIGNAIKSLQYDGHYFWSLQDEGTGFLIRCWELSNALCKLVRFFSFQDNSYINYASSAFGVEHYITHISSDLISTSNILNINEYYNNVIDTGVVLTLGPNIYGDCEDVVVDHVTGINIHITNKTKHLYKKNDLVSFSKSLLIFNDYDGISPSNGSLLCIDSHTGMVITSTSGVEYKDVKAATFCRLKNTFVDHPDAYSLTYIKGTSAKFRDMSDLVDRYTSSVVNDPFILEGPPNPKTWSIEYGNPEITNESLFLSTIAGEEDSLKSKWAVLSDFNATVSGSFIEGTTFLTGPGEVRNFLKINQTDGVSFETGISYLKITPLLTTNLLLGFDMSLTSGGNLYDGSGNANIGYLVNGAAVTSGISYNSLDFVPNAYSYTTYSGTLASGVGTLAATFWAKCDNFNDSTLFMIKSKDPVEIVKSWTSGPYSNNTNIYKVLEILSATSLVVTVSGETEPNYDFITIYNEDNQEVFRHSGSINSTFTVPGYKITAHFTSDVSVTKSGVTVTIKGDMIPNIEVVSNSANSTITIKSNVSSNTVGSLTLQVNKWYALAFVFNLGSTSLYINGKLIGTITLGFNTFEFLGLDWLYLGHSPLNTGDYFTGQLRDIKIYSQLLTAIDISNMYYMESIFNNRLNFYTSLDGEITYITTLSSGIDNYILGINKTNDYISASCEEITSSGVYKSTTTVPFSVSKSEAYLSLGLYSINATASGVILNAFTIDNGLIHYPNKNEVLYGIANLENVKVDQSTILPIYDISIMDSTLYRLQRGATYYGTDNSWATYNYQLTPLRPFIDFITVGAKPTILPANGKNVADINILVTDQYGNPALNRPVSLIDDNTVGFMTSATVYTGDINSHPGEAIGVYKAGVDVTPVLITAKVTQYD